MSRVPATARILALLPLGTVAVQQLRATAACGDGAQSCLQAAGQGWLGWAGALALVAFAALMAGGVLRLARGLAPAGAPVPLMRAWGVSSLGLLATCGGQELLTGLLAPGATPLAGGWLLAAGLCAAIGLLLALLLRAGHAAAVLLARLTPRAGRPPHARALSALQPSGAAPRRAPLPPLAGAAAGRAPPATA